MSSSNFTKFVASVIIHGFLPGVIYASMVERGQAPNPVVILSQQVNQLIK